jgi:hypothetical protein
VPAHHDIVDNRQCFGRIVFGDAFHHSRKHIGAGESQSLLDIFSDNLLAGETDYLIESRLRVTHRAIASACNLANCFIRNRNLFPVSNQSQAFGDLRRRDGAEFENLAARRNCFRHLVRVGRCHDEDDIRGRLFDRFQQRIKRRGREHVYFVDYENLVAIACRPDANTVYDYVADIIDAGVRGGVDLQNVHRTAFRDLATRRTSLFVSRCARRRGRFVRFVTVEPFGDQSRGGCLAYATGAGKEICVMQTVVLERVLERARQHFLTGYICKCLRTPLAGDYLIGHLSTGST